MKSTEMDAVKNMEKPCPSNALLQYWPVLVPPTRNFSELLRPLIMETASTSNLDELAAPWSGSCTR
jgi:hypothetical protein